MEFIASRLSRKHVIYLIWFQKGSFEEEEEDVVFHLLTLLQQLCKAAKERKQKEDSVEEAQV